MIAHLISCHCAIRYSLFNAIVVVTVWCIEVTALCVKARLVLGIPRIVVTVLLYITA